jgi:HAD superfamily hydrolase (TIGR01509 family)
MKTKGLIFDVDGTLVDTEELHRQAFNQAFVDFKLDWTWSPELYAELLSYSGGIDRLAAYILRLNLRESERAYLNQIIPMIHREKTQIYIELVHGTAVRPRTGVARVIGEALDLGLKVGLVATSAFPDVRGLITSALGEKVATDLDPIVCADQVTNKKPAPDLYQMALNLIRLPAEACVAFEDSMNGLASAKGASIFTVVTPSRWTEGQDFRGADVLLSTLGDPDRPLDAADADAIGGYRYFTVSDLEALRFGPLNGAAAAAASQL